LLSVLPSGLKGLSFAALTAAVVASLAGKANSVATIFSLDIYQKVFNKTASERQLVNSGKITIIVSMILAVLIAPHLGIDKKGGYEYIHEYTGFVSPGIFAMFILVFFWKKTTSNAALFGTIGGFLLSVFFKFLPNFADLSFLNTTGFAVINPASGLYEILFLDRMGFVFVICIIGMYVISKIENAKGVVPNGLEVDAKMFKAHPGFVVGALIVTLIIATMYIMYW